MGKKIYSPNLSIIEIRKWATRAGTDLLSSSKDFMAYPKSHIYSFYIALHRFYASQNEFNTPSLVLLLFDFKSPLSVKKKIELSFPVVRAMP